MNTFNKRAKKQNKKKNKTREKTTNLTIREKINSPTPTPSTLTITRRKEWSEKTYKTCQENVDSDLKHLNLIGCPSKKLYAAMKVMYYIQNN